MNLLWRFALAGLCLLGSFTVQAQTSPCATQICAQPYHLLSAASTNATSVKAGPGALHMIFAVNTNTAIAYLKFYDKATAPTCNTDAVKLTVPIPGTAASTNPQPIIIPMGNVGFGFSAGIGLCITAGQADNDNANATTGITVGLGYR